MIFKNLSKLSPISISNQINNNHSGYKYTRGVSSNDSFNSVACSGGICGNGGDAGGNGGNGGNGGSGGNGGWCSNNNNNNNGQLSKILVVQINATYIVVSSFPNNDCSGSTLAVSVVSVVNGQCYTSGLGKSYKYTLDSGAVTVSNYLDDACSVPLGTTINSEPLGTCLSVPLSPGINRYYRFQTSEFPLSPLPYFLFYEKHITTSNCGDTTNAGRVLIGVSETCVRSEAFDTLITNISPQAGGGGLNFNYATSTTCGQGTATLHGVDCPQLGSVPDNIAYASVVPSPYGLVFKNGTTLTLTTITIPGFSSNMPDYFTYSMPGYAISYQASTNGIGTRIPLASNCPATGCTVTIPAPIPTPGKGIRIYAIPNLYVPQDMGGTYVSKVMQLPYAPNVTSINFTGATADSVTFDYVLDDSSYGSETTYVVKVNGVESSSNASCVTGPSCTIGGLAAVVAASGSPNITLSVSAVTSSFSSLKVLSVITTVYQPVTNIQIPTLTATTTKSVSLSYALVGGDQRFPISVSVKVNDQVSSNCSSTPANFTTTTSCLISGLTPDTTNTISFTTLNNGYQYTQSTTIKTLASISGQTLTVVSATTKTVTVAYSYIGGAPSDTVVTFTVNSTAVTCEPVQAGGSTSQCTISSLTAGSTQTIVATFTNDGTQVAATTVATTYPLVANTDAIIVQHNSYFNVSYSSTGGVPGATTYSALVNGASVNLTATPAGYFIYTYENERYPSEQTFTIIMRANNDGSSSQKTVSFTTYVVPSGFSTNQVFGINSVNMTWTELVGGQPDSTYYVATLGFESGPNIVMCNSTTQLYCYIDNLVSDVEYQYGFYAYNSFFNPLYSTGDSHTYPELNENCIDNCNDRGRCMIGNCDCNLNPQWDGPSCGIKLSSNTTKSIVLTPSTTDTASKPILSISFNNQVKYSIGLLKLVEKDTVNNNNNTDVRTLDLTTLSGWTVTAGNSLTFRGQGLSIFFGATLVDQDNEEVYFAGQRYNNTAGSVLYNITISGWTFASPDNQFEIHTSISNPSICNDTVTNSKFETPNNLTSSLLIGDSTVSEALLQGKLVHASMIDTLPNIISYRSESGGTVNTTTIVAVTPSFRQSITIQPSFHIINRNLTQECATTDLVSSATKNLSKLSPISISNQFNNNHSGYKYTSRGVTNDSFNSVACSGGICGNGGDAGGNGGNGGWW
ncbi:hypothetical protein DFA_06336 [Cavenderia fasciculata]|uniref:Fibronectin type-III domain-containing protein n=1 Tax=Cavenderia fasciculata TaxID=261658 RepID=F4PKR5_CACFS|nr:uncharacterized protein DFA_06336 [Cavenderia fasciculata]EGG24189.1 hypothetical protein DFA_06336 [Cavenderia fasciculata]|eukprot:XP_004362040.1 hypothetical protein DFA_06336 [Cavenderia fasciculata]